MSDVPDDAPGMPTMEQIEHWYTEGPPDQQWSNHGALRHVAHCAARHALTTVQRIDNAERRTLWTQCAEWMWSQGFAATPTNATREAERRWPDPVPAYTLYRVGEEAVRVRADGRVQILENADRVTEPDGWRDLIPSQVGMLVALGAAASKAMEGK